MKSFKYQSIYYLFITVLFFLLMVSCKPAKQSQLSVSENTKEEEDNKGNILFLTLKINKDEIIMTGEAVLIYEGQIAQ